MNLQSGNVSGSRLMLKRKPVVIDGAPAVLNKIWAIMPTLAPLSFGPRCITDLSNPTTVE